MSPVFDKKFASFQVLSSSNGHLSPLSLSRQEKRWLLRRSTENQATIKTEHAKTPSHLHSTTGRFNFLGMQNVIDLINSDNKTSADSHVLCITSRAPGLTMTGLRDWAHITMSLMLLLVSVSSPRITFLHTDIRLVSHHQMSVSAPAPVNIAADHRWSEQSINASNENNNRTNKQRKSLTRERKRTKRIVLKLASF